MENNIHTLQDIEHTQHTQVHTFANQGLQGYQIIIEADMNRSLPSIEIIGLPDAAIKEAKERIRSSFRHVQLDIPKYKIILNLSPSDSKKVGTRFDLPMAVAILGLMFQEAYNNSILHTAIIIGELGLQGSIKKVDGVLPTILAAKSIGHTIFFVPYESSHELRFIDGITVYPVQHFSEIVNLVTKGIHINTLTISPLETCIHTTQQDLGFDSIIGHDLIKRGLSIALAGRHNVLMIGTPGSGKTILAQAMQYHQSSMSHDEIISVSQIYSLIGGLSTSQPMIVERPFRHVHHTTSKIAIIGGGIKLNPGEVSLAHSGILFFDELAEFPKEVLEVLRQPLEDKCITINRIIGSVHYPANFQFIATMNPCKCGFYNDSERNCSCSIKEITRYQKTISGPLLDRFDMILEVPRISTQKLLASSSYTTKNTQDRNKTISSAVLLQQKRYNTTHFSSNASLHGLQLRTYAPLNQECNDFLTQAGNNLSLSPRVIHKMIKVARTIADLENKESISIQHIAEAIQYRNKNMLII